MDSSTLYLRLELPAQGESAPVKLLHLLHAISLAGKVLGHGVPLAAVQEAVRDADVAGSSSTTRLRHGWQQHPSLPLGAVTIGLLAILLVYIVAVLPAPDDENILIKVADCSTLNAGYLWWKAF